jgi:hypothetical protein
MIEIDAQYIPYLKGEKFSNGITFQVSDLIEENRRIDIIKKACIGKRIIHVGCVDHIPLIKEKVNNETWLHQIITEASEKTIGVDINEKGIDYIRKELAIDNVIAADISADNIPEIENAKWDYMLLGEIIEHVDNPILFLQNIRKKYSGIVKEIYITAPNIMVKKRFKDMLSSDSEIINTDHRFWFSPYTLSKVLYISGFNDIRLDFADRTSLNNYELVKRKLKLITNQKVKYPFYYFNSVVGIAKFS